MKQSTPIFQALTQLTTQSSSLMTMCALAAPCVLTDAPPVSSHSAKWSTTPRLKGKPTPVPTPTATHTACDSEDKTNPNG